MRRASGVLLALVLAAGARGGAGRAPGRSLLDSVAQPILGTGGGLLRGVGNYALGRLFDALDVVEANVAVGPGLKAGAEYAVLRTTLGYVEAQRLGLDGRQVGSWGERNAAFGIFPASLLFAPFELAKSRGGIWETLAVGGFELGSLGVERISREDFLTTTVHYREAVAAGPWHERRGDICAVGGELHLLLVGARARAKPLELVDFVLGFVGVDLDPRLAHPDPKAQLRR